MPTCGFYGKTLVSMLLWTSHWGLSSHSQKKRSIASKLRVPSMQKIVISWCQVWWVSCKCRRFPAIRYNQFGSRHRSRCQCIFIKQNQFVLSFSKFWASLRQSTVQLGQLLLVAWAINSFTGFSKVKPQNTELIPKTQSNAFFPNPFCLEVGFAFWEWSLQDLFHLWFS